MLKVCCNYLHHDTLRHLWSGTRGAVRVGVKDTSLCSFISTCIATDSGNYMTSVVILTNELMVFVPVYT